LSDLLASPQERLTSVKLGQEIHRKHDIHSLHFVHRCLFKVINHLLTFPHIILEQYLGAMRYLGVCVIHNCFIHDCVILVSQCINRYCLNWCTLSC